MVKSKYVIGIFLVLLLSVVSVVMADAPGIDGITPLSPVSSTGTTPQSFSFNANQTVNISWLINGTEVPGSSQTDVESGSYTNDTPVVGFWNVTAVISNINGTITNQWDWSVNAAEPSTSAISDPQPSSPVNSTIGAEQTFNVTVNQTANVSWKINGNEIQNQSVGVNTKSEFTNSTTGIGEHTVTAQAFNDNGSSNIQSWTWNISSSGPGPVTNIQATKGATWINWTWTDPEVDFNHTVVSINGTWKVNTTNESFNYTSFTPGTPYTISLQTVDTNGISGSAVTNTTSTMNTPTGSWITLNFTDVSLNFSNVVGEGDTSVTTTPNHPVHHPDFDAAGLYYEITSTADTGGHNVTVGITVPSGYSPEDLNMYRYNGSGWKDVTTKREGSKVKGNVTGFSTFVLGEPPRPGFSGEFPSPLTPVETIFPASQLFRVTVDQNVSVVWSISPGTPDDAVPVSAGSETNRTYTPSAAGNFTVSVNATNTTTGLSNTTSWIWTVRPRTFETGNRVWDASKDMSLTYTWNPMSFYAFYYDLDSNVGNESLKITLGSNKDRDITRDNIVYTAAPDSVSFKYRDWGKYDVIGFMAEKYFAGYTAGETHRDITDRTISTLSSRQLHRVISDDDTRRTVFVGNTLTLAEGYVLKVTDISTDRQIILSLLKDGGEVDSDVISENETYVYRKRVGTVNDLPIIAVNIRSIFSGAESSAVFTDGIFQISESYTSVNLGNIYGIMKITRVDTTGIEMKNDIPLSLSAGSTNDLMGDVKINVADNSSVLRFAPFVQKTGVYEVRGTISTHSDTTFEWTPMNFEGFYYNLDEDVGSENITMTRTDRSIAENNLVYTSTPESVRFEYRDFGSYNVIGFMAEKYFAGYSAVTNRDITGGTTISTISQRQLHKVLTDDRTKRTVFVGTTLTLGEGYVLRVTDISTDRQIIIQLLKDGGEVDLDVVSEDDIYVYRKRVGTVNDLPVIAVHIRSIFFGAESSAVFTEGIFQLSESYITVNSGDRFGIMEVSEVSDTRIQMRNPSVFALNPSQGSDLDVMGDIKFKVADDANSSVVRFYPYIMFDSGLAAANQLAIDAPSNPVERDTITITVTAGGTAVEGAEVSFSNTVIGETDSAGRINYTLTSSGSHNITATKLGYQSATKSIMVEEYVDIQLKFDLPAIIDQNIPVTIKVTAGEIAIAGANITLNGVEIGETDIRGELIYTFDISGTHNLGASKTDYISVLREINIRMPFSEYRALDINLSPPVIFEGGETLIRANITNIGTIGEDRQVELIINSTVVDNKSLFLEPGEVKEINFTHKVELPEGNYTVEILGQRDVLRVDKKETSLLLIGGILTGIGAILIYLFTSKKLTLVMVKEYIANLNAETIKEGLRNAPETIRQGLTKAGWKLRDIFNEVISKFRKP